MTLSNLNSVCFIFPEAPIFKGTYLGSVRVVQAENNLNNYDNDHIVGICEHRRTGGLVFGGGGCKNIARIFE